MVDAPEFAHDGGQGGGHDGLIERTYKHGKHEPGEHGDERTLVDSFLVFRRRNGACSFTNGGGHVFPLFVACLLLDYRLLFDYRRQATIKPKRRLRDDSAEIVK